jgi:hypothetical protein
MDHFYRCALPLSKFVGAFRFRFGVIDVEWDVVTFQMVDEDRDEGRLCGSV